MAQRTADVTLEAALSSIDFSHFLLSESILKSLQVQGFVKPSPVQFRAIPVALTGGDLIIQAKSGTGKTLVFAIAALEFIATRKLITNSKFPSVLIFAPTREVAVQIGQVIEALGSRLNGLSVGTFIGGDVVQKDIALLKKSCHIAIGTPGRMEQLIHCGALKLSEVRMIVIDEFDTEGFLDKIEHLVLHEEMPEEQVQVIACSATVTSEVLDRIKTWMLSTPNEVMLDPLKPSLEGVRQFYLLSDPLKKWESLISILQTIPFHQCVVFSNYKSHAEDILSMLERAGWPALYIAGGLAQHERNMAISRLKAFKLRVLVSTDVIARGVDVDKVTLVINLDLPRDKETYLHRVGRTGRFGSKGTAVSIVDEQELSQLREYAEGSGSDLREFDSKQVEIEAKEIVSQKVVTKQEEEEMRRITKRTKKKSHDKHKKKPHHTEHVLFPWNLTSKRFPVTEVILPSGLIFLEREH
jgi:ATP-dependent RNA helicase DDX20